MDTKKHTILFWEVTAFWWEKTTWMEQIKQNALTLCQCFFFLVGSLALVGFYIISHLPAYNGLDLREMERMDVSNCRPSSPVLFPHEQPFVWIEGELATHKVFLESTFPDRMGLLYTWRRDPFNIRKKADRDPTLALNLWNAGIMHQMFPLPGMCTNPRMSWDKMAPLFKLLADTCPTAEKRVFIF